MKTKLILVILIFLYCYLLKAQSPIISRTNYFDIGDSVLIYHKLDISLRNFSVGPAGANIFWDFSSMNFNHSSVSVDTLFYISPEGTPFYPSYLSADYSRSNLCCLRKTTEFNYYYSNQDSVSFIGHWANNGLTEVWEDHCDDFLKELIFPFSFPNSFIDSYNRYYFDVSGSDDHYITGTNFVEVDGYGSLKTPDGNILNNVLRIHSVLSIRDSNYFFGISNKTQYSYQWYSPDRKGFILSFVMSNNDSTIETADYQKKFNIINSVNNLVEIENSLIIYPNPSSDFIELNDYIMKNNSITIYSFTGQEVYHILVFKKIINISFLPTGIYFLKAGTKVYKFVKI